MSEPSSDDPDGGNGGDEPRARDLATTPAPEGTQHPMDPATIAQLASWFDLPSFDEVAEQQEAARAEAEEKTGVQKVLEVRAKALANIEPAFMARLDGRRAAGARLPQIPPLEVRWERRVLAFDESQVPEAIDPDYLPEVYIPPQLVKDLKDCTPQAFLRDLHRPDKEFYIQLQPAFEDVGEIEMPDPMGPIRETVRADYRVGVVAPAVTTMAEGIADLRAILARPWAEGKRDRARKREAELLGKEAGAIPVTPVPEGAP